MATYSREQIQNRIAAIERGLKTNNIPRYMTRADVKKTLRFNQYILKRMGNKDNVTIPNSELDKVAKEA